MILPQDRSASALPYAQLTIQRRMHPDIARIPRLIYPRLRNHDSTHKREHPVGLQHRMFWWDHRVPELGETSVTKSHINEHEVKMVTGLVHYLLKGNAYSLGDIAVLTPYTGQLAALYQSLGTSCRIWLSRADREQILEVDELELADHKPHEKDVVKMSDMLRVATIDNFQGEEAKIVIVSTVRSGGRPGFLSIQNRINVACSRAQNGFYIIGNSLTLQKVPMWRNILNVFGNRVGPALSLRCDRHPEHKAVVEHPEDFDDVYDCPVACDQQLRCGHQCIEKCHPLSLHENGEIPCQEPCIKTLACGHPCRRTCGVTCGPCEWPLQTVELKCGHMGQKKCSDEISDCEEVVKTEMRPCGHAVEYLCGRTSLQKKCERLCDRLLDCGHRCTESCELCSKSKNHRGIPCVAKCDKTLACGHACRSACGHNGQCRPCTQKIIVSCEHGSQLRPCRDQKALCFKSQDQSCDGTCPKGSPCCLPDPSLPSNRSCDVVLGCSHSCPSLHGEDCIPEEKCPSCKGSVLDKPILFIRECGHVVEVADMDRLNCQDVYVVNEEGDICDFGRPNIRNLRQPRCTTCAGPCRNIRRYKAIGKLADLHATLRQLLVDVFAKGLQRYSMDLVNLDKELSSSFEMWAASIQPLASNATYNARKVESRIRDLLQLQRMVLVYKGKRLEAIPENRPETDRSNRRGSNANRRDPSPPQGTDTNTFRLSANH
jgi:hypothetical protein